MAFLDDVSKMFSDVTSTAAEKTKEFTEISRLKADINTAEENFEAACTEIGKIYFEKHKEDFEECYSHFMNTAIDAKRTIAESEKQILIIKGVVTCEGCGHEVSLNVAFCSNCGKAVPKLEPVSDPNLLVCSRCGNGMPNTMKFCTQCGNPLQIALVAEAQPVPAEQSPYYEQPAPQTEIQPQPTPQTDFQYEYQPGYSDPMLRLGLSDEYQNLGFAPEAPADNGIISSASYAMDQDDSALPMFEGQFNAPASQEDFLDLFSTEQKAASQQNEKICNVCGKKLSYDSVFCTECGSRV